MERQVLEEVAQVLLNLLDLQHISWADEVADEDLCGRVVIGRENMKRPDAVASGHITFGWFIVWSLCVIVASVVVVVVVGREFASVSDAARTSAVKRLL